MNPNTIVLVLVGVGAALLVLVVLVTRRMVAGGYPWSRALAVDAVAAIGGIGAVQSYTALRGLAELGDLPWWLAAVAPATIDLFAPVMGLAALEARRHGRDRYAERLALGYSVAAIVANVGAAAMDAAAHPNYAPARVALVIVWHTAPVVTFLLGSHWLMRRHAVGDQVVDVEAVVAQLADATSALEASRAQADELARALDEAKVRRSDGAVGESGRRATPAAKRTAPGTAKRAPNGTRADEMRALLAEPGGRDLTGDELGARLGIDAGYARRLRSEVERADTERGRRPHVVELEAAAPAAAAVATEG